MVVREGQLGSKEKGRRAIAEFNGAPPEVRERFWREIGAQAEEVHRVEEQVTEAFGDPEAGRRAGAYAAEVGRVSWGESWWRRSKAARRIARRPEDDLGAQVEALRDLPAPDYFAALAGIDVPDRGGPIPCPLPDHDDRTPSCQVYPDERGWYCHSCHIGGGVIELAAELWGLERRGEDFVQIVKRLGEVLG